MVESFRSNILINNLGRGNLREKSRVESYSSMGEMLLTFDVKDNDLDMNNTPGSTIQQRPEKEAIRTTSCPVRVENVNRRTAQDIQAKRFVRLLRPKCLKALACRVDMCVYISSGSRKWFVCLVQNMARESHVLVTREVRTSVTLIDCLLAHGVVLLVQLQQLQLEKLNWQWHLGCST